MKQRKASVHQSNLLRRRTRQLSCTASNEQAMLMKCNDPAGAGQGLSAGMKQDGWNYPPAMMGIAYVCSQSARVIRSGSHQLSIPCLQVRLGSDKQSGKLHMVAPVLTAKQQAANSRQQRRTHPHISARLFCRG